MSPLDRRQFLLGSGLTLGAAGVAGAGGALVGRRTARHSWEPPVPARAAATVEDFDPRDWREVRRQFPLDRSRHNLSAFLLAPHPHPVRRAIEIHREALDADPEEYWRVYGVGLDNAAVGAAAGYLGADPDEVVLTQSTTMGLALVANGLRLRPSDEILLTAHEHYSCAEAFRFRSQRSAVRLRQVRLYEPDEPPTGAGLVQRLTDAISRRTRLVVVTWVHSSTGVKLPIQQIAAAIAEVNRGRARERRVVLAVDGVHGFGTEPLDVETLGADIFVSGCHKWLFGPRGTGLIWARRDVWPELQPTVPSFRPEPYGAWLRGEDSAEVPPSHAVEPGGFHAFEHRWALPAAFELHAAVGRDRIVHRTAELARALRFGLAELPSVRLRTPLDEELSSGIVCFDVSGLDPVAVIDALRERDVLGSVTPYAERHARLGVGIWSDEDDVAAALEAVAALGR